MHSSRFFVLAEQLLGQSPTANDGVSEERLIACETRLNIGLPVALRTFYKILGNTTAITQSFNRFLPPEQLQLKDKWLTFVDENQEVCSWALNLAEFSENDPPVYQSQDRQTYHSEQVGLNQFVEICIYYQLAQGGYRYAALIDVEQKNRVSELLKMLSENRNWNLAVEHNGLTIYSKQSVLIWFFTDQSNWPNEQLFASSLHQSDLNAFIDQFGFLEL